MIMQATVILSRCYRARVWMYCLCRLRSAVTGTITRPAIRRLWIAKRSLLRGFWENMSSVSFTLVRRGLALAFALVFSTVSARAEEPAVPAAINPAAAETCVAVFTVMAYAYADDDLKERQLEEKKILAQADIRPQQDAVSVEVPPTDGQSSDLSSPGVQAVLPQSSQDRVQHIMDVLTEMMLHAPAQAQGIAKECFRKYPPEIELN
jgi:hypothetical protein